jgi:hypothetical protein
MRPGSLILEETDRRAPMMTASREFERLEETVSLIRRHPDFPGKGEILDQCLVDIDERLHQGRLTPDQRDRLRSLLLLPLSHCA